ncbi:MAG: formate dehydrogenase accessory sulfurtransferase FdhD, partial [Peptostreptococcaceae bacterium]
MNQNTFDVPIIKLEEFRYSRTEDKIIVEYPLSLVLNGKYKKTFLCTPNQLEELVVGYLLTKGYIRSIDDVIGIEIDEESKVSNVNIKEISDNESEVDIALNELYSVKYSNAKEGSNIYVDTIYDIVKANLNYSKLFKDTGGAHSVAIFEEDKEIVMCEDVARHNAMDKAIGYCVLNKIPLDNKAIVASGRISFEMISKVAKAEIPIVISKSAPTNLSVDLARKLNITLIGFVRGKRMNIYTYPNRV